MSIFSSFLFCIFCEDKKIELRDLHCAMPLNYGSNEFHEFSPLLHLLSETFRCCRRRLENFAKEKKDVPSCHTGSIAVACQCRRGSLLDGLGFGHLVVVTSVAAMDHMASARRRMKKRSSVEKADNVGVEVEEENRQRRGQKDGR